VKTNDEWDELGYQYERIRYWKDKDKELYDFYKNGTP